VISAIAALPMYDFPELREAHDLVWAALARNLIERGVRDVPRHLTRGGEHKEVWRHPSLLFGQACEYPLAKSFREELTLVATPCYSAPGCDEAWYRSAIIVRARDSAESLAELRGRRCVINEPDSNSGMNLLRAAIAPLAAGRPFFKSVRVSGSHRRSVEAVAADKADIAAIDCVTFAHLRQLHPDLTAQVRVLCWSPHSPSLPFVTARLTDESTVQALRASLAAVFEEAELAAVREQLFLEGVDLAPDAALTRVSQLERDAAGLAWF
jgi:ABC-type phosphate/phosphonate transport system substrate-binding protein